MAGINRGKKTHMPSMLNVLNNFFNSNSKLLNQYGDTLICLYLLILTVCI